MGTNDNRDRKLLHHEKPIWQHAFKESMKHTSVEGAERNGWKAVDACYRVGLFHDIPPDASNEKRIDTKSNNSTIYEDAWRVLIDWLSVSEDVTELTIDTPHKLVELMDRFGTGTISYDEFKKQLNDLDSFV